MEVRNAPKRCFEKETWTYIKLIIKNMPMMKLYNLYIIIDWRLLKPYLRHAHLKRMASSTPHFHLELILHLPSWDPRPQEAQKGKLKKSKTGFSIGNSYHFLQRFSKTKGKSNIKRKERNRLWNSRAAFIIGQTSLWSPACDHRVGPEMGKNENRFDPKTSPKLNPQKRKSRKKHGEFHFKPKQNPKPPIKPTKHPHVHPPHKVTSSATDGRCSGAKGTEASALPPTVWRRGRGGLPKRFPKEGLGGGLVPLGFQQPLKKKKKKRYILT